MLGLVIGNQRSLRRIALSSTIHDLSHRSCFSDAETPSGIAIKSAVRKTPI